MKRIIGYTMLWLAVIHFSAFCANTSFHILHSFPEGSDGYGCAYDSFIINGSTLYGCCDAGGAYNCGALFSIQLDGSKYHLIYSFSQADKIFPCPYAIVLDGPTIFGTSLSGGAYGWGAIYSIQTNGTGLRLLHSFTRTNGDGAILYSRVVPSGSRLYGVATIGGTNDNGVVYSLQKDGSDYRILHTFLGNADGGRPYGAPTINGSTLYGMSSFRNYKMNVDGSAYTVLDGPCGISKLTLSGSTLYGIGGNSVFRIDTNGANYQLLHLLEGESQSGLALVGSTLYGVTRWGGISNVGTIFSVNTDGSGYQVLHTFVGGSGDGAQPLADPVVIGSRLYGTTSVGGPSGLGVVFALDLPVPPTIVNSPGTQTAEAGTPLTLSVQVSGAPPFAYQWLFNGTALGGATSSTLQFLNVQSSDGGAYSVVVTNAFGGATSAPATLGVIPPVERRIVPALTLDGQPGASLHLEQRSILDLTGSWLSLDTVNLANPPQFYFDLTSPLPPQGFYRAWQSAPFTPLTLDLHLVPAITLTGTIGSSVRLDYINQFGPIDAWVTNLATVTLTNTSQLYFDTSVIGQPARLYRLVPAP